MNIQLSSKDLNCKILSVISSIPLHSPNIQDFLSMLNNDNHLAGMGAVIFRKTSALGNEGPRPSQTVVGEELPSSKPDAGVPVIPQLRGGVKSEYQVLDQPLGTLDGVRIITIGAGASGINMAYQVKNYLKEATHVVYDKNPGLGGTWFENRYSGCKCDIRKFGLDLKLVSMVLTAM